MQARNSDWTKIRRKRSEETKGLSEKTKLPEVKEKLTFNSEKANRSNAKQVKVEQSKTVY